MRIRLRYIMAKFFILFVLFTLFGFQERRNINTLPEVCVSAEETKLYDLIMEYRKQKKLPPIRLSRSLTYVAQQHCIDLVTNRPDKKNCNAHSWSNKGKWSACCYTPDHKQAQCMWDKPRELTNYKDNGFEIACGSSDPEFDNYVMTAEYALTSWKGSPGHNSVIINLNKWKDQEWKAIGIGVYKQFAVVWFGKSEDTEGIPAECK